MSDARPEAATENDPAGTAGPATADAAGSRTAAGDKREPAVGSRNGAGAQPPLPQGAPPRSGARGRLRRLGVPIAIALAVLVGIAALLYWRANVGWVKTDNAQTAGDLAPVSPQVTGRVLRVHVLENQYVTTGQVLVTLDPSDYQLALNQAQAQLTAAQAQVRAAQAALTAQEQQFTTGVSAAEAAVAAAQPRLPQAQAQLAMQEGTTAAQVRQAQAQVTTARANLTAAQSNLQTAATTLSRDRALFAGGAIAAQQVDVDTNAYRTAQAQYQAAQDALRQAQDTLASAEASRQQVAVAQATVAENAGQIAQAQAQLKQAQAQAALVRQRAQELAADQAQAANAAQAVRTAELNLSRTQIRAPADGWVTSASPVGLSVAPGQVVQPNQPLFYLTLAHHIWVQANIKETQLGGIRVGDPVRITVDALPGRVFHGHVQSIGATTGSATALLPPDNATGNFVKVVQLVPVNIALDPNTDPGHALQVGLSAEVAIDTNHVSATHPSAP
jgi:membrane fusion protein (multidrug efflux system)